MKSVKGIRVAGVHYYILERQLTGLNGESLIRKNEREKRRGGDGITQKRLERNGLRERERERETGEKG